MPPSFIEYYNFSLYILAAALYFNYYFLPNTTNMQNIFDCIYSVTRNTPIICQVPNEVVGICLCLCVCACVCAHIYVMSMFPLILYNTEFITLFYNSKNLWLTEVTYLERSGLNDISSPCTPTI